MYGNNMMYGGYPFNPSIGQQGTAQAPFMGGAMSTPVQQQPASPAFLQVGTAKEFDNVTIQPGRQALIMEQNDPYIAFKSADAMGMVTNNLYRLEPITADQINDPATEYATKGELAQLQTRPASFYMPLTERTVSRYSQSWTISWTQSALQLHALMIAL